MTGDFFENLINILSKICKNLERLPFWQDYTFWLGVVNLILLVITLYFLYRYTRATEKMALYQIIPIIDVNMIYDKNIKKTYFWFLNGSNLPGYVFLEYKKNKEDRKPVYHPLYIAPNEKGKKTATTFEFSPKPGDDFILYISITPSLDKSDIKFEFEKKYGFSEDDKWNELSWSFPDSPFPIS